MDVKQEPTGSISQGLLGVSEPRSAAGQSAEVAADARAAAERSTGDRAAVEEQPPSLAVKTLPGTSRRKRKSGKPSPCFPLYTPAFSSAVKVEMLLVSKSRCITGTLVESQFV